MTETRMAQQRILVIDDDASVTDFLAGDWPTKGAPWRWPTVARPSWTWCENGALSDDLLSHHKAISELPGEEYHDLIVAWDLHTYLLKAVQYSPVICLFAVPERGKSCTGKGMIHIAYRGIHVESLRDAYLVRVAHDLRASLFLDVKDIWAKAEKNGSEDILLHRFEKGAKVPRVLYPSGGLIGIWSITPSSAQQS